MYAVVPDLEKTLTEASDQAPVIALKPQGDPLSLTARAARAVLRTLGPGLEPLFYARAMALQLQAAGARFERSASIDVRFRGSSLGHRRVDFLLDDLIVDLVGSPAIEGTDVARLRSTLMAARKQTGLLLCFAREPLQMRLVRLGAVSERG
jgi:GxxExxY protein